MNKSIIIYIAFSLVLSFGCQNDVMEYYRNGKPKIIRYFHEDMVETIWLDSIKGDTIRIIESSLNKKHTATMKLYLNGGLHQIMPLKKSKAHGIVTIYDEQGKLYAELNYKYAKLDSFSNYYFQGKLYKQLYYVDSTLYSGYYLDSTASYYNKIIIAPKLIKRTSYIGYLSYKYKIYLHQEHLQPEKIYATYSLRNFDTKREILNGKVEFNLEGETEVLLPLNELNLKTEYELEFNVIHFLDVGRNENQGSISTVIDKFVVD